jgi:hypothetical protein
VLVNLMAKATGADEQQARELLMSVTSTEGRGRPLHVPPEGDAEAFARLWQDDIEVRRHGRTGWKATRSGIVVLPIPAACSFLLPHDSVLPRGAVMVAAVAAAGVGLTDAVLRPVDRGPTASIGEMPEPRA